MAIINLKEFYPWYSHDELIEVSDEVAAELLADKRYQKSHERTLRRNKVHSLDAGDGMEAAASVCSSGSPEAVLEMMDRHCRLCQALNSLPEVQGRRIDAHFILGMSQAEIAKAEGVTKGAVSLSIDKGLATMKVFLKKIDLGAKLLPDFCPDM